ncbi:MAG: hypothetical protein LC775_06440 [Acidobacteria bacterium]|nr:hypothetical protein [Acidobacteriota bacterium]
MAQAAALITVVSGMLAILGYFGINWINDDASNGGGESSISGDGINGNGGGGTSETESSSAPTHDEYVAAADRVCGQWFSQIGDVPSNASLEQIQAYQIRIESILQNAIRNWESIPPPTGERELVDKIIDLNYQLLRELEDASAQFRATGDATAINNLGGPGSVINETRRLMQEFGFRVCTPSFA